MAIRRDAWQRESKKTIHAVYEQGVFRPLEKVELPERTEVEFEPKILGNGLPKNPNMSGIVEVMSRRFRSGQHDLPETAR